MKQKTAYRTAILALSASVVLPIAPVFGQDAAAPPPVVVTPPSPVTTAPPPRIVVTPPAARQPAPAPAPRVTLPPVPEVQAPAPSEARTATRANRAAPRARAAAPRATAAPAPAAESAAPAPTAEAPLPAAEPAPLAAPPAALGPATGATGEADREPATGAPLLWLLAALTAIAAFAFFALRRGRRRVDEEVYSEEPALVAEPATIPAAPAVYQEPLIAPATFAREPEPAPAETNVTEEATVAEPDETDVAALAATSEPVAGRPWLEFLLRPIRAGTSRDETIVQYELTVANTGGRDAGNVRLSTWLFPAGTSEMERSLIEAPAGAHTTELDIAAGEGARIEGEISLAKAGNADETILPVLAAEARYRLPDGSEGRTRASFEIGMQANGELAPFPLDRATGLVEFVEARLHGEPERV